jgi:hypothetical protein
MAVPGSSLGSPLAMKFEKTKPRAKPIYNTHAKWTPAEDLRLAQLVQTYGPKSWRIVAQYMVGRNSRQCRERWLYYLDPELNVRPWEANEDAILEEKFREIGPKWMLMVPFFHHRTDAMIKNRFQVLRRKEKRTAAADAYSSSPAPWSMDSTSNADIFDFFAIGAQDGPHAQLDSFFSADAAWKFDGDVFFTL